jgi:hypothetical protein
MTNSAPEPPEPATPRKRHFFNKFDLISFLLKSMRLNAKEEAIKALWILLEEGTSQWYLAKKLVQFASEDATGPEAFVYAQSVFQFITAVKDETNSLSRLVLYLCDSEKMWETEKETEWEIRRLNIQDEIASCYRKGVKPMELPSHVFDVYTARGKSAMRRGEKFDRRFSGVREGSGLFSRACFLRDGMLDPAKTIVTQAYSPHLLRCIEEKLHVDAYLRKYGITVDDFLKL